MSDSRNILYVLNKIKERPGMYVCNNTYEQQYRELQVLIIGYELALANHQIPEVGSQFLRCFGEFLNVEFGWSMSCGPLAAIEFEVGSPEKAWYRFWELLDLYKLSLSNT